MSQQQQPFSVKDKEGHAGPSSSLDIYDEAVKPSADDEFLDSSNLGLGYYETKEYWLQVESFRKGLYADAAFSRTLIERSISETKHFLGREKWENLPDGKREEYDRRRYIDIKGEEIWEQLDEAQKFETLGEVTGITSDWRPPFWRMMMMRHEASRSRGARLLDNLFGRVSEFKSDGDDDARKQFWRLGGKK